MEEAGAWESGLDDGQIIWQVGFPERTKMEGEIFRASMHRSWVGTARTKPQGGGSAGGVPRGMSTVAHTLLYTTAFTQNQRVSSISDGTISSPRYEHSPNSLIWKSVRGLSFCQAYSLSLPEVHSTPGSDLAAVTCPAILTRHLLQDCWGWEVA